jgi:hypothetical protein
LAGLAGTLPLSYSLTLYPNPKNKQTYTEEKKTRAFSPCSGTTTPYVLEYFDITPYPAPAGEAVEILAVGKASITIAEGSTIHTSFKQGPLTTPEKTYNLCSTSGGACVPIGGGQLDHDGHAT